MSLQLNGGSLDGAHLAVTSDTVHEDEEHDGSEHIEQSDKPRAGIVAEYLARGYTLSDQILQRAIEVDSACDSLASFEKTMSDMLNRPEGDLQALLELLPVHRHYAR